MAIDIRGVPSSYDDGESKRRAAARKRFIRLLVAFVAIAIVRYVVKDPPPPKPADHSDKPFRALPGVLAKMPVSEQIKLKPEILAQLKEADRRSKNIKTLHEEAIALGNYNPAQPPPENLSDKAMDEEFRYQYVRRQKIIEQKKEEVVADITKTTLVRFTNGRYVKARGTRTVEPFVAIEMDKTLVASVPKKLIFSVTNDALTWEEPVAKGDVRLKPAKGITITVNKSVADRITITKPVRNES